MRWSAWRFQRTYPGFRSRRPLGITYLYINFSVRKQTCFRRCTVWCLCGVCVCIYLYEVHRDRAVRPCVMCVCVIKKKFAHTYPRNPAMLSRLFYGIIFASIVGPPKEGGSNIFCVLCILHMINRSSLNQIQ